MIVLDTFVKVTGTCLLFLPISFAHHVHKFSPTFDHEIPYLNLTDDVSLRLERNDPTIRSAWKFIARD